MQPVQLVLSAHEHRGGEVNGHGLLYPIEASPTPWGITGAALPEAVPSEVVARPMCLSAALAKYHVDQWTDLNETRRNQSLFYYLLRSVPFKMATAAICDFSKHKTAVTQSIFKIPSSNYKTCPHYML